MGEPREISFRSSLRTELARTNWPMSLWTSRRMVSERKEHSHSVECDGHSTRELQTSSGKLRNATAAEYFSNASWGWGARSGNDDDKDDLSEIIKAELIKTGNHGLDEELAEAIKKDFYESYNRWKTDHPNASTRKQIRQWVESWNAHLGDRATPIALVDAVNRKRLT